MKYDIKIQNAAIWRFFSDKALHSKPRTQCFSKGEIFFSGGLSLEAKHQRSGGSFRDFLVKTTMES